MYHILTIKDHRVVVWVKYELQSSIRRVQIKGERAIKRVEEIRMIYRWVKREDYWTNIASPDFDRDLKCRGYLEIRERGLSDLREDKKTACGCCGTRSSELLRQSNTTYTGYVLWRCADIPGSGSQASPVQKVRKSETGEASRWQTILFTRSDFPTMWDGSVEA